MMKFYLPAGLIAAVLLFIPIPALAVDILYMLIWVFAAFILSEEIKYSKDLRALPRLLLFAGIGVLAVSISFTRAIINGDRSVLYKYISALNFNFIINIFVAVAIMTTLFIITKDGVERTVKVALNFSLDTMSQRLFDVDNELSKGTITSDQATQKKKEIQLDIDFCNCLDGSEKFLLGDVKALIFIYVVSVAGGCLSGILYKAQTWQEALLDYSFLALLNVILYTVPLVMLDVAVIHAIKH
jgi:flagellar biosynthesis protein FlhA